MEYLDVVDTITVTLQVRNMSVQDLRYMLAGQTGQLASKMRIFTTSPHRVMQDSELIAGHQALVCVHMDALPFCCFGDVPGALPP